MAYTPTQWVNGQPPALNAENLNKIERGIEKTTNKVDSFLGITTGGEEYVYTDYSWELGTINGTTGENRDDTTRVRTVGYIPVENLVKIQTNIKRINICYYTNNTGGFIRNSGWIDIPVNVTKADMPESTKYVRIIYLATTGAESDCVVTMKTPEEHTGGEWSAFKESYNESAGTVLNEGRFDNQFNLIAYSFVRGLDGQMLAPINSEPMFREAAKLDYFKSLKCDVRVTADNKLILCHDSGFTFDSNGRIAATYVESDSTPIRSLTYSEILELEYAQQYQGNYVHPCDLTKFLTICKRYGKIPFITIRNEYIDIAAPLIINELKMFNLIEEAIINSDVYESLMAIRALDDRVYLSEWFTPFNSTFRNNGLAHAKANKNYLLSLFYEQGSYTIDSIISDSTIMAWLEVLRENNIRYYGAQTTSMAGVEKAIAIGFSGTQHKKVEDD